MQIKVETAQSFHFTAENLAEMVVAYLAEHHHVGVEVEDVIFAVRSGGGYGDDYAAPSLTGATVKRMVASPTVRRP